MRKCRCITTIYIPNRRAEPRFYDVTLIKTDCRNCNLCLKDAVFELRKLDERSCRYVTVAENLRTDSNGKVTLKNLAGSRYWLVEQCAPPGYLCCQSGWAFCLCPCCTRGRREIELVLCNRKRSCRGCPCCGK